MEARIDVVFLAGYAGYAGYGRYRGYTVASSFPFRPPISSFKAPHRDDLYLVLQDAIRTCPAAVESPSFYLTHSSRPPLLALLALATFVYPVGPLRGLRGFIQRFR